MKTADVPVPWMAVVSGVEKYAQRAGDSCATTTDPRAACGPVAYQTA